MSKDRLPLYTPLVLPLWLLFVGLALLFFWLVLAHVLTISLGLPPTVVMLVLAASFLGGAVNFPVARLEGEEQPALTAQRFLGMRYLVPTTRRTQTILAVNVGGCLVPVGVSVYLLLTRPDMIVPAAVCVAGAAAVTHSLSRVVQGVGVAVPFFLPPVASALLAAALAPEGLASPVAYVTGSLGTLIGGDLLNLGKIIKMGPPVASIGGAGTWDGVFLSGLLASVLTF